MPKSITPQPLAVPTEGDSAFRWASVFLLVLAEFTLYAAGLFHGLVAEDYVFHSVHGMSIGTFWTSPIEGTAYWRPFSITAKYLLFDWFGEAPSLWHLTNIILHTAAVLLLFNVLLSVSRYLRTKKVAPALMGTLLFQVHPASVQNVSWVSGFSELICILSFLLVIKLALSVITAERTSPGDMIGVALATLAALLSKESAVAIVVVLPCLFLLISPGSGWKERGQWVVKHCLRILGIVWGMTAVFLAFYWVVAGEELVEHLSASTPGVFSVGTRALAMIAVPTDALTVYSWTTWSPWIPAAIGLVLVSFLGFVVWKKYVDGVSWAALCVLTAGLMSPYVVGGYISLRLMNQAILFLSLAAVILLLRNTAWKDTAQGRGVIRGFVSVYLVVTAIFSFSAVLDWHVADRYGTAMRFAFEDFHDQTDQPAYAFAALPARLRQAEILGEPATDFHGQMRLDGIDTTLDLHAMLRIVLLERNAETANVRISDVTENSLVIQTHADNQLFLPGDIAGPQELPVGSIFLQGPYTLRVLKTVLNDRPVALQVSAAAADLQALVFYDDVNQRFLYLDQYLGINEDQDHD